MAKRQTGVFCALFAMTLLSRDNWGPGERHPAMQERIDHVLRQMDDETKVTFPIPTLPSGADHWPVARTMAACRRPASGLGPVTRFVARQRRPTRPPARPSPVRSSGAPAPPRPLLFPSCPAAARRPTRAGTLVHDDRAPPSATADDARPRRKLGRPDRRLKNLGQIRQRHHPLAPDLSRPRHPPLLHPRTDGVRAQPQHDGRLLNAQGNASWVLRQQQMEHAIRHRTTK